MADNNTPVADIGGISEEARKRVEELIEEEEGAHNRYRGMLAVLMTLCAVVMSLFHLYGAYSIVPTQSLRPVHVAFVLVLTFLVFPAAARFRRPAICAAEQPIGDSCRVGPGAADGSASAAAVSSNSETGVSQLRSAPSHGCQRALLGPSSQQRLNA